MRPLSLIFFFLFSFFGSYAQEELEGYNKKELKELLLQERAHAKALKSEIEEKEDAMIELRTSFQSQVSMLEKEIGRLTTEAAELQKTTDRNKNTIDSLNALIVSSERRFTEKEKEMQSTINRLKVDVELNKPRADSPIPEQLPAKSEVKRFTGKTYTYDGNYSFGKAKYDYYESEDNRIYHGQFYFSGDIEKHYQWQEEQEGRFQFQGYGIPVCSGFFNHDKKSGIWKYAYVSPNSNKVDTFFAAMGKYVDGRKEGSWRFVCYEGAENKSHPSYEFSIMYSKGNPVGKFSFSWVMDDYNAKYKEISGLKITGQFTEGGRADGLWTSVIALQGIDYEIKETFLNGVALKYIRKDLSTGKVISSVDKTEEYAEKFANKSPSSSFIDYRLIDGNDHDGSLNIAFIEFLHGEASSMEGPFYGSLEWMFDSH